MQDSTPARTALDAVQTTPGAVLRLSGLTKTFHPHRHAEVPVLRGSTSTSAAAKSSR